MQPMTGKISTEEHIESWNKQKEFISSEPTGPNFSEYKIGAESAIIAEVDAAMRSLPQQYIWRYIH